MDSIAVTLGAGSGIDTRALVSSLVEAQFAAKSNALTARKDTLTSQISALSQLRSGLTGFSTALTNLVSGGSLSTQPVSADKSVLGVALLPGANIGGLSATVEVRQLATSQVVTSAIVADKAAPFGKGTLTISLGQVAYDGMGVPTGMTPKAGATPITVTIGDGQNSLTGIADAINAAKAGVTATVITDSTGSRLSVKGATGAEQGFMIDVAEDGGAPGLAALGFNAGAQPMTANGRAQDAKVALDGVEVLRPSNSFSDLIPGVKLDLVRASPGQQISLTTSRPTEALAQAVNDFVSTYNELIGVLKTETALGVGVLRSDTGVKEMARQMRELTGRNLNASGAVGEPFSLAQLGVATNRDGTLSVNASALQSAIANTGGAVEKMLTVGLSGAMRTISLGLTAPTGGLSASQTGYTRLQTALGKEQERIDTETERLRERLTRQFAGMDARVSAYKATQSFLDQQIKSWTRDG